MIEISDVFMDGDHIQVQIDDLNTTITLVFETREEYEAFRAALKPYEELPNLSPSLDPRKKEIET